MDGELTQVKAALAHRYAVEREIGHGGMASVYLAEDLKHRRKVAIKVLRPDLAASIGAERFLREIEIAAGLAHPHILPLHDSGVADELLYYVMPFVEGQTLRQRMIQTQLADGGPMPLDEAVRIARGVAEALDYAHRRHIIHRDIKPENILLADGHAVVADFGIARALSAAGGATLTRAGMPLGTPRYMSPEQAMGDSDLDGRTDIYSLGVVLYEMLVGEPPRSSSERHAIATGRGSGSSDIPRKRFDALPAGVTAALAKAMAEEPAQRFATANDFLKALEGETTGWSRNRRRLVWGGSTAAALVVAGVAGWLVTASHSLNTDRVLVGAFANATGDSTLAPFGMIVADWLARGLQETGTIEVVDARSVAASDQLAANDGSVRTLARDVGAGVVVDGAYYLDGDSLRIQARLTETRTGVLLSAFDPVAGPRDAPLGAVESLGQRVMGTIASLSDQVWPTQSFRPPSYPAYLEYVTAVPLVGQLDYQGAAEHMLRAASLDRTFTLPLIYAAVLLMEVDQFALADSLRGMVALARAQLRPGEQHMLEYMDARMRGDYDAALGAIRPIARVAPLSEATFEVAQMLLRTNRPREALDIFEGLDPTRGFLQGWWFVWDQHASAHHMLDEHQAELQTARRGRAQYPNEVGVLAAELAALAALGRVDELNGLLDEVIALTPQNAQTPWPPLWQLTEAAMELRAHGHVDASKAVLERARNSLETYPGAAGHPWTPPHLATISYLSERWDEAQQRFTALAEESPTDVNYRGYLGVLAARRDDRQEATRISTWLRDVDQPYLYGINTLWRARIAALLGEPDEATALLRAAFEQGLTHYGTGPFYWQSRADVAWLHRDMDLESLRSFPPFQELARPHG